jgi:hypothetical protein
MSAKEQKRNGKLESTAGGLRSKEIRQPSKELEKLLGTIYRRYQRLENRVADADAQRDFVFHMTDWLDDLDRLKAIYDHPEKWDRDQAGRDVYGFLLHVIPHLKAAGRLLLGEVSDPFEESLFKK